MTGSAAGDVKSGTGAIELDRLRMDRQQPAGVSVLRQYALPGQTYRIEAGETIELWAEYSGVNNPRLIVDWGAGEPNSPEFIGCGSCLLTHRYANAGRYTVVVKLDDRVSTTVTRTFFLDGQPGLSQTSLVYSQVFVAGTSYGPGTPQFDSWGPFRASLDTGARTFSSVTFSGSNDPAVLTCSDPAAVAQIANALRTPAGLNVACDGHNWNVNPGCGAGPALGVDTANSCASCADAFAIRPNIGAGNANWGGFNSVSCSSGPTQSLTLTFVGTP